MSVSAKYFFANQYFWLHLSLNKTSTIMRLIPYGETDYVTIRKENSYYIDKTAFIRNFENAAKYIIFLRPRRFGKSLFLNTLDAYYVANKTKNSMYMDVYNNQTTTTDYIFFLSSDEYTEHKDKIKAQTLTTWPLRTNAYDDPNQTLFVNDSTKLIERGYYYGGDAIRPAMYVNLGGLVEEDTSTTTDTTTTSSTTTSSSTNTSTSTTTDTSSTSSASTTTTDTSSTTDSSSTSSTTSSSSSQKAVTQKSYANNATNIGNINLPDDSSYSMKSGSTAQVAIDMNYLNSTDKQYTVTYKSSNANVFTVDSNGKITSTGTGTASLTVRMKKSNGKIYTMTCRIDVT